MKKAGVSTPDAWLARAKAYFDDGDLGQPLGDTFRCQAPSPFMA